MTKLPTKAKKLQNKFRTKNHFNIFKNKMMNAVYYNLFTIIKRTKIK